ncbi:hypothetical protein N9W89_01680 [Hellea sp.]|nr:hypothetical protein [Hellea sp.]
MNAALDISPSSSQVGDVSGAMPEFSNHEFWGADLALRIWLWISQLCALSIKPRRTFLAQGLLGSTQLRDIYTPYQMARRRKAAAAKAMAAKAVSLDSAASKPAVKKHKIQELRHDRRLGARQARGIMPVSRYSVHFIRQYLIRGMSSRRARYYALRLSHILPVKVHVRFCPRFLSLITDKAAAQIIALCGAPLSPD